MTSFQIGDIVEGEVTGIQNYGIFVKISDKMQGLVHISECQHGFISSLEELVHIGDKVKVQVIDIDEYTHKISLSMRTLSKLNVPMHPAKIKHRYRKRLPNIGFQTLADKMPEWIDEGLKLIERDELGFNANSKFKV